MKLTTNYTLWFFVVAVITVAGGAKQAMAVEQTCTSDTGAEVASGACSPLGGYRCRNGGWDKVTTCPAMVKPSFGHPGPAAVASPAAKQAEKIDAPSVKVAKQNAPSRMPAGIPTSNEGRPDTGKVIRVGEDAKTITIETQDGDLTLNRYAKSANDPNAAMLKIQTLPKVGDEFDMRMSRECRRMIRDCTGTVWVRSGGKECFCFTTLK